MPLPQRLNELLGRTIVATVDKMGWRGEGLIRCENGWLSVRGVLPGESVNIDVADWKASRGHAYASLTSIVESAADRAPSTCDAFPRCNGCQLLHVGHEHERQLKVEWVREILDKYSGFRDVAVEWIGAPQRQALRHRGVMHVSPDSSGLRIPGFDALQSMTTCPALTPSARRAVATIEHAVKGCEGSVAWIAPEDGEVLVDLRLDAPEKAVALIRDHAMGVFIDGDHVSGATTTQLTYPFDIRVACDLFAWTHATHAPAQALYSWLHAQLADQSRVLELGCGIGTSAAVAIAAGANHVWGVDHNRSAIALAERNVSDRVTFRCADFEKALRQFAMEKQTFDTVVVNPMREPLGDRTMSYINTLCSGRVIFLAPSPVSGAQDLETLRNKGWDHLVKCAAIDLHPATYHVMLGAVIESSRN